MTPRSKASRAAICLIATGGLGVLGVGAAVAASSQPATIHGCVANSTGALRIVAHVSACKENERTLSFNVRGPQGLRGVRGAAGPKPTTFQMYANVDAEGDLGSNSGAMSARRVQGNIEYVVTFDRPIGHCAAVVQAGLAGGPDATVLADSTVTDSGANSFYVDFGRPDANDDGWAREADPFMLVVTCSNG